MSPARSGGRYGRRRRKKREACREPGAKRRAIRQATSPGAGASDAGYAGSSEPAGAKDPRSRHCRLERGKDERCRLCRQQRGDGGERTQGRHCRPKRTGRGRAEERGAAAAEKRGGGDGEDSGGEARGRRGEKRREAARVCGGEGRSPRPKWSEAHKAAGDCGGFSSSTPPAPQTFRTARSQRASEPSGERAKRKGKVVLTDFFPQKLN